MLRLLTQGLDVVVRLHSRAGLLHCSGPGSWAHGRRTSARCGVPLGKVCYDPYITGSLERYVPEKYGIPIVTVELPGRRLNAGLGAALFEGAR